MITIVALPTFLDDARKLISNDILDSLQWHLARFPDVGDLIKGTGGIRKIRWSREGIGKSGGVRIMYFYYNNSIPLFLFAIFGKGEKANISDKEKTFFKKYIGALLKAYKVKT